MMAPSMGDFQFAFDDVPHLLVRMVVAMDRRALFERVIGERHVRGVEEFAVPAGLALDGLQFAGVYERHEATLAIVSPDNTALLPHSIVQNRQRRRQPDHTSMSA